ncbi:MAG: methyltransferase domain-containing protein [Alphaproteobacteria bacterium]|nr:methyltransferase domain-containing protein [Alphaproteobacteria bacterium]
MLTQLQAPYDYIRDYYSEVRQRIAEHPDVASFWLSSLSHIKGRSVLNAGCGPTLYDYLVHFGEPPEEYVGLDVNESTFDFLLRTEDPELLQLKAKAAAQGTRTEYLCADVFNCGEALKDRFDSILGVGFFATFQGERFDRLMRLMHRSLKPDGRLLKVTWHGPHRTAAETADKLRYRFDSPEEPTPGELVSAIERAGFSCEYNAVLRCDPEIVYWDAIQVSLFDRKAGDAAAQAAD